MSLRQPDEYHQISQTSNNLETLSNTLSILKENPIHDEEIAVKKLLEKHIPDYKEKYPYLQLGEFSDIFIN